MLRAIHHVAETMSNIIYDILYSYLSRNRPAQARENRRLEPGDGRTIFETAETLPRRDQALGGRASDGATVAR